MVITLIGYRGTGKTTLAVPLAAGLGWRVIDADVELERRAGRTIRQIFDTDGEGEFRRLERETLIDLLGEDRLVIAAGGGAVINADTRRDIRAAGPVVWLTASVDTIQQRLFGDVTTTQRRPNLTARGGRQEIEELLRTREPFYSECATLTVSTDQPLPRQTRLSSTGAPPTSDELADFVIAELGLSPDS